MDTVESHTLPVALRPLACLSLSLCPEQTCQFVHLSAINIADLGRGWKERRGVTEPPCVRGGGEGGVFNFFLQLYFSPVPQLIAAQIDSDLLTVCSIHRSPLARPGQPQHCPSSNTTLSSIPCNSVGPHPCLWSILICSHFLKLANKIHLDKFRKPLMLLYMYDWSPNQLFSLLPTSDPSTSPPAYLSTLHHLISLYCIIWAACLKLPNIFDQFSSFSALCQCLVTATTSYCLLQFNSEIESCKI